MLSPATSSPTLSDNESDKNEALSLDERTKQAADRDPEFAAALQRTREREAEQAKLMCSIENKEACVMCSA